MKDTPQITEFIENMNVNDTAIVNIQRTKNDEYIKLLIVTKYDRDSDDGNIGNAFKSLANGWKNTSSARLYEPGLAEQYKEMFPFLAPSIDKFMEGDEDQMFVGNVKGVVNPTLKGRDFCISYRESLIPEDEYTYNNRRCLRSPDGKKVVHHRGYLLYSITGFSPTPSYQRFPEEAREVSTGDPSDFWSFRPDDSQQFVNSVLAGREKLPVEEDVADVESQLDGKLAV